MVTNYDEKDLRQAVTEAGASRFVPNADKTVGNFNYLTPRILGGRLNLHPMAVFLGLLIGGKLFGLLGVRDVGSRFRLKRTS